MLEQQTPRTRWLAQADSACRSQVHPEGGAHLKLLALPAPLQGLHPAPTEVSETLPSKSGESLIQPLFLRAMDDCVH